MKAQKKIASELEAKANAFVVIYLRIMKTLLSKTNWRTTANLANAKLLNSYQEDLKNLGSGIYLGARDSISIYGGLVVSANTPMNSTVLSNLTSARIAAVLIFNPISAAFLVTRSLKIMRQFGKYKRKDNKQVNVGESNSSRLLITLIYNWQQCRN